MNRRTVLAATLAIAAGFSLHGAEAGSPPFYTGLVEGTGAGGYDVVAYFSEKKPVKGDPAITAEYGGVTWRFSSDENRATFLDDPVKYAPQYGGYCAYAVSQGGTAKGDPEAWTVVDGKLYLNYSDYVRGIWSQDIPGNIKKANNQWPYVLE